MARHGAAGPSYIEKRIREYRLLELRGQQERANALTVLPRSIRSMAKVVAPLEFRLPECFRVAF